MTLREPEKAAHSEKRRRANAMYEEERALRREERQRDWVAKDMYLTREQAAAGEACRGAACQLSITWEIGRRPCDLRMMSARSMTLRRNNF